ncbi:hypothetical protein [Amycolatopsis pigmentata]|uniref:DUF3558 domain-containing protein n=1 Tax=Amycolatopsis pigmentata TaxID=450801 RepID=A0ABW5FSP7_9PSEU
MRHGRVVFVAAVVLAGVTGCANRPNNLETYYQKPESSPTASASAPAPASPPARVQASVPAQADAVAQQVTDAVLTQSDLAREGVRPATDRAANGACFNAVPAGDPRGASWRYSSGSTLTQQVTGYLDKLATDVLGQVQCEGQKLTLTLPQGATAERGWCQNSTCTVLLATGHVLSGLQVNATSSSRAADAVKALAPIAAGKLPSN